MNIKHLQFFLAVIDEGSITAAAQRCFVTQPTLSAGIHALENEIGGKLLERSKQGCTLTTLGRNIEETARGVVHRVHLLKTATDKQDVSHLRIAISQTVPQTLVQSTLHRLSQAGDYRFRILDSEPLTAASQLANGKADLLLCTGLESASQRCITLNEDRFGLALNKQHPLASRRRLRPQDTDNQALIVRIQSEETDLATAALRECNARPQVVARVNSDALALTLVASNIGMCVFPQHQCQDENVVWLPVSGIQASRKVLLRWKDPIWDNLVENMQ